MFLLATYLSHLLLIAGYIESNPGPNQAGRPRKATSISDFPSLQPNAFQASRLPSDDRLSQILDLTIISTIEDVIAELQTANRALINTMENKFDRLISTIEPRMASFENKLSTLQADMVSLANRVSFTFHCKHCTTCSCYIINWHICSSHQASVTYSCIASLGYSFVSK